MKRMFPATFILALLFSFCFSTFSLAANPTKGDAWPPANILKEFGLEGMPQPAGTKDIWWRDAEPEEARNLPGGPIPHILVGLKGTDATGNSLKSWFEANGWSLISSNNNVFSYNKGGSVAVFDFSDATGQLKAGVHTGTWPNNAVWERFELGGLVVPSGVAVAEVSDSQNEVNVFTLGGDNAAYLDLRNQFIAKMGQPMESEGKDSDTTRQDAFWNAKTNVAVYLGREGTFLDFSVIQK